MSLPPSRVGRGLIPRIRNRATTSEVPRLAPEAEFAFNDLAPVVGIAAIADFVGAWKNNFASVTHDRANLAVGSATSTIAVGIVVGYGFRDGRQSMLRVVRSRCHRRADHRVAGLGKHKPAELTAEQESPCPSTSPPI